MKELAKCRFCAGLPGIEGPVDDIEAGRGAVYRIECGCNMDYEYDLKHDGPWIVYIGDSGLESESEFGKLDECVHGWNELQKVGNHIDEELLEILEGEREPFSIYDHINITVDVDGGTMQVCK